MHSPLLPKTPPPPPPSPSSPPETDHLRLTLEETKPPPPPPPPSKNANIQLILKESTSILSICIPMTLSGLLMYSRSLISLLFLGRLGDLPLAAGSLALGFANITGYSILSGLALGMEPICGQAFGAQTRSLLGLEAHFKTTILLLFTSLPISLLWLNMYSILRACGQDVAIARQAQLYLIFSLPDLLIQSVIQPTRIYLRTQSITAPITFTAALAVALHFPINYLLVCRLELGIKGVALGGVLTNLNLLIFLGFYTIILRPDNNSDYRQLLKITKPRFNLNGYHRLLGLAVPSCAAVCLEWWWYEIMTLLCGLLSHPTAAIAAMGVLIQTTSLIYIFPSSLSLGVSTRVGNRLGANRPNEAKLAALTGLFFSFILGLTALLFTITIRHKWASLFTQDKDITTLTAIVLPIIGLCELGNSPQTTLCGVLRGSAKPKTGANINFGCFYMVGLPVAVWLGFGAGFGFKGLWLGMLAAQAACVVSMMVMLHRMDWESEAERAMDLTAGGSPVFGHGEEREIKRNTFVS